jgi:hypothetical protein
MRHESPESLVGFVALMEVFAWIVGEGLVVPGFAEDHVGKVVEWQEEVR